MAKNVPLKFQFQDQIMILTLVSHGHAIRGRLQTTFTRDGGGVGSPQMLKKSQRS